MSTITAGKVTPEEFLAMPDSGRYELVDGKLVAVNVSVRSSRIAGIVYWTIQSYCNETQLGLAWPPDTMVRCYPDPNKFRKPDGCFVRMERIPADWSEEAALEIAPDLVVEVVSPNDLAYEVQKKIREYLGAGVRLVWVIYPEEKLVSIHRIDRTVEERSAGEDLEGEDVLPGFRVAVASLFPDRPRLPVRVEESPKG